MALTAIHWRPRALEKAVYSFPDWQISMTLSHICCSICFDCCIMRSFWRLSAYFTLADRCFIVFWQKDCLGVAGEMPLSFNFYFSVLNFHIIPSTRKNKQTKLLRRGKLKTEDILLGGSYCFYSIQAFCALSITHTHMHTHLFPRYILTGQTLVTDSILLPLLIYRLRISVTVKETKTARQTHTHKQTHPFYLLVLPPPNSLFFSGYKDLPRNHCLNRERANPSASSAN